MEPLDPLSEWLGLPPGRHPADHYELLGLDRFEGDLDLISHRADTLRAQIRKIRPGRHLVEWQRLLDRVAAAKRCLSDPISKVAYDESLETPSERTLESSANLPYNVFAEANVTPLDQVEAQDSPPDGREGPSHGLPEAAQWRQSAEAAEWADGQSEVEAPPIVAPPDTRPAGADAGPPEVVLTVPRIARWRGRGARWAVRVLLLSLVLLGVAIGLAVLQRRQRLETATQPGRSGERKVASEGADSSVPALVPSAAQSGLSDSGRPGRPSHATEQAEPATAPVKPAGAPDTASSPSAPVTGAPLRPPRPSAEAIDPARQRGFTQAIGEARFALASRNLSLAKEKLALAVSLAQTEENRGEVGRLETLHDHVEAFWGSLKPLVAAMQSGSEIEVGDARAMVVEAGPDFVVLRAAGRNRRYNTEALPHRVAAAMAEQLFSSSGNAKALRAAFLTVEPDGDLNEARRLLHEARQDGTEVGELLEEVDRQMAPTR